MRQSRPIPVEIRSSLWLLAVGLAVVLLVPLSAKPNFESSAHEYLQTLETVSRLLFTLQFYTSTGASTADRLRCVRAEMINRELRTYILQDALKKCNALFKRLHVMPRMLPLRHRVLNDAC